MSSSFANWSNWGSLISEIGRLRAGENPLNVGAVKGCLGAVGAAVAGLRGLGLSV